MAANVLTMKTTMLQVLDELPAERVAEVLDFALFLNAQQHHDAVATLPLPLPAVPATQLTSLIGLVAWGGDAVADVERLYEL